MASNQASLAIFLFILVVFPTTISNQPVYFQLPKLDLPSPEDIYNKFHNDVSKIRNDFLELKAGLDQFEMPEFDWDAVAEVREVLTEYMQDTDGNCEKIPHTKFVEPETNMTTCQLVKHLGYPCEEYEVVTEDNYILGVHRIPHGKGQKTGPRPVAFLQHGLLDCSSTWVANLANESLGTVLADAGYDVWLGNVRGNTYSKRHTKMDPKNDKAYWAFSWDEMARYDLPAMINYALLISGQSQLYYIGHSQGTMIGFARFSEDQELAKKVKYFIALGPVSTIGEIKSPIRLLAPFSKDIKFLYYALGGSGEFLPSSPLMRWLATTVCRKPIGVACENILFLAAGFDCIDLNVTRIPVYVSHLPAGTSVQNVVHYAQQVVSKKFQAYDYGEKGNLKHYNQKTPHEYHPENLRIPLALYWGGKDWLADPKDVELLIRKLRHIDHNVYLPSVDHLDFVWGLASDRLIYQDILRLLKKHPINVIHVDDR